MTSPLPTQPEEAKNAVGAPFRDAALQLRRYNRVIAKYCEWREEYRGFYGEYPRKVWMLPE